jgi:DNA-binding protein YbaB
MANSLPSFFTLAGPLAQLQRGITTFKSGLASITSQQQSSDHLVTVVANGLGRIVSITIDPSLVAAGDNVGLAAKVQSVANAAIAAAITTASTNAVTFAKALALPGLPAYGASPPTFVGFTPTVTLVQQVALANNICQLSTQFTCRSGPVAATVNSNRQIVTLTFDAPLPEVVGYLQASAVAAINCAVGESTTQPPAQDPVPGVVGTTVTFSEIILYANSELDIDDSVEVMGVGCQGFALVANAGTGPTNIGSATSVGGVDVGAVVSRGQVVVRDRGRVHGPITTESTLVVQNNTSITGPIKQNTAVVLPILKVGVTFPATAANGITVAPNTSGGTVGPAYYRSITVNAGATLTLTGGVYYTDSLDLEPNSKVIIDATNGPVILWVRTTLIFRGVFQDKAGVFPRVWMGYIGTTFAALEAPYQGSFVAPNASIRLATVGAPGHVGSWHALQLEVSPNQTVCLRPFELPFQSIPGARPPDTPPVPVSPATLSVLGFEDATAWTSSQATLTSVTTPITQGSKALSVSNIHGFTTVVSRAFSTVGIASPTGKLLIDIRIPSQQPNPSFFGQLDIQATSPSSNVFTADFGPQALTGLPVNAYSTLSFTIPSSVLGAIANGAVDLTLTVVLNVNNGTGTHFLDNIRFV